MSSLECISFNDRNRSLNDWPLGILFVLLACVFAFMLCAQVGLVFVWRLATFATEGRIFNERAFSAVNGVLVCVLLGMACTAVATVVVVATLGIGVPGPIAAIGVFITLTCLALALVILVMRALLRQATAFQSELEEVV